MTELLLKDLCERLYYGVVVNLPHPYEEFKAYVKAINPERGIVYYEKYGVKNSPLFDTSIWKVKPYLRPLSSMTEEEVEEYETLVGRDENVAEYIFVDRHESDQDCLCGYVDWLNAHHFDYRGLIPKGLAIEVTEENNPYKE